MSNETIVGGRISRCRAWSTVALLVASTVIAGCGQKGPLYMPAPKAAAPAGAKPATPAAANNPATPEPVENTTAPAR
ncbi:LPS translocon maturation chaperone LptM [Hydrogenophaga luteola]|uniref:Lipoprotein n=1 Tax=Hydrogenophaga luteola TaxID=1591122 RepID=A0ABV7W9T8_9BURK